MKHGTTLFLKVSVVLIGIPVLAFGVFGLVWLASNPANPKYAHLLYPIVAGIYASVIPFFLALVQAFMLLNFIDRNQAFSAFSVNALKRIKFCAIAICGLFAAVMPFVYLLADLDDAPGLIIVGMVPVFASLVIAVFAAILQKLFKEAIDIKSENELTV